jgi:hypothetical protein
VVGNSAWVSNAGLSIQREWIQKVRLSPAHGGRVRPSGQKNGAYRTGRYTAQAKAERRQARMLIRELRHPIDSGE